MRFPQPFSQLDAQSSIFHAWNQGTKIEQLFTSSEHFYKGYFYFILEANIFSVSIDFAVIAFFILYIYIYIEYTIVRTLSFICAGWSTIFAKLGNVLNIVQRWGNHLYCRWPTLPLGMRQNVRKLWFTMKFDDNMAIDVLSAYISIHCVCHLIFILFNSFFFLYTFFTCSIPNWMMMILYWSIVLFVCARFLGVNVLIVNYNDNLSLSSIATKWFSFFCDAVDDVSMWCDVTWQPPSFVCVHLRIAWKNCLVFSLILLIYFSI